MVNLKRKNLKKIIIIISLMVMFMIMLTLLINRNVTQEKSNTIELIDIIDEDGEELLSRKELDDYESKINRELNKELNKELEGSKDIYKIKLSYYALGAIKYLKNEYDESIKILNIALKYNGLETIDKRESELNIKIYSALSSNLIQKGKKEESEVFFKQAKSIAFEINEKHLLCELYYGRAKAKAGAGHNINESINLIKKSLQYTDSDSHRVRNYLYLSTLYKLSNKFDLASEYTINALKIAMELNDNILINKCVINLGENYYIQKNYSKTIRIYEDFIKSGRLENIDNILTIYGYLAECYARNDDYENYKVYRDKHIKLSIENNSINNLIWIYANSAELETNFNNIEKAKEYLSKGQELYSKNSKDAPGSVDILLDYTKNKIEYIENRDYNKAIENYDRILKDLDERGIESDIKDLIVREVLDISFVNKDYEVFEKYAKDLESNKISNASQAYTDSIFTAVNNALKEKVILESKMKVLILLIATTISIYVLWNSIRKNKKINKLNLQLKELNTIDQLTKVYNRGYLNEQLKISHEEKLRIRFIMIDIDYFKLYNDNYGHVNGDNALIEVARIIKSVFKDDMVFRYGGEEFSVISYKSQEEVVRYLEKLRLKLYNENIVHEFSGVSDRITLSIGMSSSNLDTENSLVDLIRVADENLYKSKKEGRNRYTY